MIDLMREVALEWLKEKLEPNSTRPAAEVYDAIRRDRPTLLFPYLVEQVEGADARRYYVLAADPKDVDTAILDAREMRPGDGGNLPFNQPSGSQSAALGPVIKRTAPAKAKEAGPSAKIRETTLKSFARLGEESTPWADYFREVHLCWTRKRLRTPKGIVEAPDGVYAAAVEAIEEKKTCLLAYAAGRGRRPGEVPDYAAYLQQVLATTKYTTGSVPKAGPGVCPMCGEEGVDLYPNVMRNAGVNISNLDRDGAFPGLDPSAAWKGFAPCLACADLLYIYCRHASREFMTEAAGQRALAIPSLHIRDGLRSQLLPQIKTWARDVASKSEAVGQREFGVLRRLAESQAVQSVSLVWAEFGQRIEEVCGVVTEILPSRLNFLSTLHANFKPDHPAFPERELDDFRYELSLKIVWSLLRRPGGKAAQKRNESRRLFDLRRDLAEAIYHRRSIPWGRFWAEWHETARWHWDDTISGNSPSYGLLREGFSEKKNTAFLTLAGWVRQTAKFLHYCRQVGAPKVPANDQRYTPKTERLQPYFGPECGIDTDARAFAFLLGVLYGKLVTIQAKRGVNIGANTLTWLRRMTLSGADLPELFVKVLGKLTEYEAASRHKRSRPIAEVETELAEIGARLGTRIDLEPTHTCYFLLLGQSLSPKILPSQPKKPKNGPPKPHLNSTGDAQ
jgi:CRISPR-associated protein Csh1